MKNSDIRFSSYLLLLHELTDYLVEVRLDLLPVEEPLEGVFAFLAIILVSLIPVGFLAEHQVLSLRAEMDDLF